MPGVMVFPQGCQPAGQTFPIGSLTNFAAWGFLKVSCAFLLYFFE